MKKCAQTQHSKPISVIIILGHFGSVWSYLMLDIPEEMVSVIFLKMGFTLILDSSTVDHLHKQRQFYPYVFLLEVNFLILFCFQCWASRCFGGSCLGSSMPSTTSLIFFHLPINIHELLRSLFSSTEGQREQGWNRLPSSSSKYAPSFFPKPQEYEILQIILSLPKFMHNKCAQNLFTINGQYPKFRDYKSEQRAFRFCNLTNTYPGNEMPSSIS